MDRHYGSPQLHALSQEPYSFAVDWQDRTCHRSLVAGKFTICQREQRMRCEENTLLTDDFNFLGRSEREGTDVKDDLDDIPMTYILYVLLVIVGIVAGAVFVIVRML